MSEIITRVPKAQVMIMSSIARLLTIIQWQFKPQEVASEYQNYSGNKAWQSNKRENGGKFELIAQEDSNLVLYVEKNGKKTDLWASNTVGKC